MRMLYLQKYQEFERSLTKCREILTLMPIDPAALKQGVDQLKHLVTTPPAATDTLDPALDLALDSGLDASLEQPIGAFEVEINKQLRLLGVDCLFLQTAKRGETVAHRLTQIHQRLDLLQRYCSGVLTLLPQS
jgi:hypothetical protein